jgi:hypothetical protein
MHIVFTLKKNTNMNVVFLLNSELFLKICCHDKCNSWISVIHKWFKYAVMYAETRICYYVCLSISISVSMCDKVSKMCMQFYQMHCLLKLNTCCKALMCYFIGLKMLFSYVKVSIKNFLAITYA